MAREEQYPYSRETRTNPRTGTIYRFPRDAKRYYHGVDRITYGDGGVGGGFVCTRGDYDCAMWEGGPCREWVVREAGVCGFAPTDE